MFKFRKQKEHIRVQYNSSNSKDNIDKTSKRIAAVVTGSFIILMIIGYQSCTRSCSSNHKAVNTNYNSENGDIRTKQATPACPTESMLRGFISAGNISNGMRAYPSCRVIYKGMKIEKILDRGWSKAKVLWIDINGNSRVDFVLIEAIR